MPTYEYACSNCANEWEEVQKISEPALEECPKCHQKTAKRQISGGRFILKGGGWYADLYSSVKPGKKDDAKSSTDTKSSGDAKSTGETKSETKSGSDGGSSSSKDGGGAPSTSPAPAASTPAK